MAPLLFIAALCIVVGGLVAPLLLIAALCIVVGATPVFDRDVQHDGDDDH